MSRAKLTEEQAQLAVWIRADLRQRLVDRAEAEGRSQKSIVEEALDRYFDSPSAGPTCATSDRRRVSG